jgi:hypothetical protein
MKLVLACAFALLALGLAAPSKAEPVYVPLIEAQESGQALATRLWISNFSRGDRSYSSVFLKSETDGTELAGRGALATVPARRAVYLERLAGEGETGLLEIESAEGLAVNAWIESGRGNRTFYAGVPAISQANRLAAGGEAYLNGLAREGQREVTSLSLVNLGGTTAQCQVDFLRADATEIAAGVTVDVPALSMRPFADALGLGFEPEARSTRVSCDQEFYAFAVAANGATGELAFVTPETAFAAATARAVPSKAEKQTIVFTQSGRFHYATKERAKAILRIPVPRQMDMARVTAELDVVAGPWNPRLKSGAHNLLFFHRGRFRSNTIANVNAFGPSRNLFKMNQNLDMRAGTNTRAEVGYTFVHGQRYHLTVVQDAASRTIFATLSQNGQTLRTLRFSGSAKNGAITVPVSGLVAEFGNYNNQGLPEVSSLAFAYENFRVEMIEK